MQDSDDEDGNTKNEEETKYHESVINNIYGEISDDESDEEQTAAQQEKVQEEIKDQAKKLEEEKRLQEADLTERIGDYFNKQVKTRAEALISQAKNKYQE